MIIDIVNIRMDGKIEVTTSQGTVELKEQQVITLHPSIQHSFKAKKECLLLLTSFHQYTDIDISIKG